MVTILISLLVYPVLPYVHQSGLRPGGESPQAYLKLAATALSSQVRLKQKLLVTQWKCSCSMRQDCKASSSTNDMDQQHQASAPQAESSGAAILLGKNAEQGTVGAVARADMSQGARMHSQQLEGSWKVFDLAAVPIDETDVDTGECCDALTRTTLQNAQNVINKLVA